MKTLNQIFNRPQIIFEEKEGAEMLAKYLEAMYNKITTHEAYYEMIKYCKENIKNTKKTKHTKARIKMFKKIKKEMNNKIAEIFYPQFNLN